MTIPQKKWVDALNSGNYIKGVACLKQEQDGVIKHCVLGVACEIFADEMGLKRLKHTDKYHFDGRPFELPPKVKDLLQLHDCTGGFKAKQHVNNTSVSALTDLNDDTPLSFEEIAQYITSNYDNIFRTDNNSDS